MPAIKQSPLNENNESRLVDLPQRKKYNVRPHDRVDNIISAALLDSPPGDNEHVYASAKIMTFQDAAGNAKSFDPVQAVSQDGRPSVIGGWLRTSNEDEISRLDEVYLKQFPGDFRKVYPVMG